MVAAAVALLGAGVLLRTDSVVALSIPIVVYLVLARVLAGTPHMDLSVMREEDGGKIFEGGVAEVVVGITNRGEKLGLLRAQDVLPPGVKVAQGSSVGFAPLSNGETVVIRYRVTSDAPGSYELGPLLLTAEDSFGLRSKSSALGLTFRLDVLPTIEQRARVPFRPARTKNWPGQVVSPKPGSGQDFYALRQYLSTDPVRTVNWKASARQDRMYSNQYMSELGAEAVLVVDKSSASDFGVPPRSALTYVDRCAAAISSGLLLAGNRVGLVVFGGTVLKVRPGTGVRHLERILLSLARVKKGPVESFGLLPAYLSLFFPNAAQIIVVSSLASPDIVVPLLALGARRDVRVVSPSLVESETWKGSGSELGELAADLVRLNRWTVMENLRRRAEVADWNVDAQLETALRHALVSRNAVVSR